jgi:putative two-component system response regulator
VTQQDAVSDSVGVKRSIFIIDDEESIRKVLFTHLSKEGFGVIQSSGGHGVFDVLKNSSFEVLICDIKMPEIEGTEVLAFAKQNFEAVPVIMLTGLTDVAVAVDVMKCGAFDYLMKPVKKDDMLNAVRRALIHRDLLLRNKQLEKENREYQLYLEEKVRERTKELDAKTAALQDAYLILKSMNMQFANVLAEIIEAKDRYTRGHCNRMRALSVALGKAAGLLPAELDALEYASLLHDLGKIGVSEAILNKEGVLTEEESRRMKEHSEIGEKILLGIPMMEEVAMITGAHHENYDGSGYPRGLHGNAIPFSSRIIAVADLYDAMCSDRPYRKGLAPDEAVKEMKRVAGFQLDPAIVDLFIKQRIYERASARE